MKLIPIFMESMILSFTFNLSRMPKMPIVSAKKIVSHLDVVDNILHEEKYSTSHRVKYGIVLMVIGVAMAKGMPHHIYVLSFIGDWVGYLFHGAGAIPIIDYFHNKIKKNESSSN